MSVKSPYAIFCGASTELRDGHASHVSFVAKMRMQGSGYLRLVSLGMPRDRARCRVGRSGAYLVQGKIHGKAMVLHSWHSVCCACVSRETVLQLFVLGTENFVCKVFSGVQTIWVYIYILNLEARGFSFSHVVTASNLWYWSLLTTSPCRLPCLHSPGLVDKHSPTRSCLTGFGKPCKPEALHATLQDLRMPPAHRVV